jgi:hypothetical protein
MIDLQGIDSKLKYEYSVYLTGKLFDKIKSRKFKPGYYVFSTKEERVLFMSELITYSLNKRNEGVPIEEDDIVHIYDEGCHVRMKHIVSYSIEYEGKTYDFEIEHPISITEDDIRETYFVKNMSCDCWKKHILNLQYNLNIPFTEKDPETGELEYHKCGKEIPYLNFNIEQVDFKKDYLRI